jgi:hypothetical protein
LLTQGLAATLSISGGERLELRSVTLPDGTEVEYFIVTGTPVTLTIDGDQTLIAEHIEIDRSSRIVRVIGFGTFASGTETIQGTNLIVELDDETFSGRDVLIVTEAIDVIGVDARRVPGQIDVLSGRFSPCSRCEQRVQDYGFRAARLELYPGDRLVAFDVTVLIRDLPVFFVPLLVVPLAPPDRQPSLSITSGSATTRAEIALDWPYVSGANAYGTFSVRYYADIAPGESNVLGNALLGGRVTEPYLGGGFDHRFFTEEGRGRFYVFYTPSFIDPRQPGGKTRDQFQVQFRYETETEVATPEIELLVERDDARRQRLTEYSITLRSAVAGLSGVFSSRGFFDLDPGDEVTEPSYGAPRRTVARLELSPETPRFSVGPFTFSDLYLDLGVFEDRPSNRRIAGEFTAQGRALLRHTTTLGPLTPWSGFSVSGRNAFTGRYYGNGDRLIAWDSTLNLRQTFGGSDFSVQFNRTIREGETPFTFDAIGIGNVIDLQAALNLRPTPWLRFSSSQRYVFVDERRPDVEGPGPLTSTLSLFDNVAWFGVEFRNSYNFQERDPGTLTTTINLRSPDRRQFDASLSVSYIQDLKVSEDRLGTGLLDETRVTAEYSFGVSPYANLRVRGGYTFNPRPPEEAGGVRDFYDPLYLELTLGTTTQSDTIPGLEIIYERDLNRAQPNRLSVDFTAQLAPFEVRLQQSFDYSIARSQSTSPPWSSLFSVRWRGVASFELRGALFLPLSLAGLEPNPATVEPWVVTLIDDLSGSGIDWRLTYQFRRDPTLNDGTGGIRDRTLDLFVNIENEQIGGFRFGVDFNARWLLADDLRLQSYVASSGLGFFADIYNTVGLKGRLSYSAVTQQVGDQTIFTTRRLTIDDVSVAVRLFDQLYLAAVFDDIWNFLDEARTTPQSPYNFQPEIRLIWDRCCWALYGSWNTATGAVSIRLTTPGGTEGLPIEFESGLRLPGRAPPTGGNP